MSLGLCPFMKVPVLYRWMVFLSAFQVCEFSPRGFHKLLLCCVLGGLKVTLNVI